MMTNLFSIFDPSNYMLKMSWILPILVIMSPLLVKNSKFNSMLMNVLNLIFIEIKTMSMSNLTAAFLMPLFASILMLNLMSMIPTLFTMNSQISVVLPMGLCFWLSIIMFFLTKKMNSFLTHLVPEGAPALLNPALVLIELTSNLIRPITLSVRLIANMTAGHLLMHLLSSLVCYIYPMSPLLIPVSMILTSLELMVAFIQAYIFCALLSLYSSEIH